MTHYAPALLLKGPNPERKSEAIDGAHTQPCLKCRGQGQVIDEELDSDSFIIRKCPDCKGTGNAPQIDVKKAG